MVDPSSKETYMEGILEEIKITLKEFYGSLDISMVDIKRDEKKINLYHGDLKDIDISSITILDDEIGVHEAEEAILEGRFFWEHTAAGEATRLGLGTKYVIDLSRFTKEVIMEMILNEMEKDGNLDRDLAAGLISDMPDPKAAIPLSLGLRHMLQMVYDVRMLAKSRGKDPDKAIKKQKTLIILNESTGQAITEELERWNYLGMDPKNVLFMVQHTFYGISIKDDELFYEEGDNKRLHNHGQMMMQKAEEGSIFRFIKGKRIPLTTKEYQEILDGCLDMLSYNIEDIDYLTGSIDYRSLALALKLGKEGYGMVMEIVAQNKIKPQKGGAAFFDPRLEKNVMIESNRLGNIKNEEITFLNRNFNHYPNPAQSFSKMRKNGLPIPFEVKEGNDGRDYIYACPVQGDMNFVAKTAFVMRKEIKPINNWKSAATTPAAVDGIVKQDRQKGFLEMVEKVRP